MNIQQALDILSKETNPDHAKYFNEQILHFKEKPESSLKSFLDTIHNDIVTWLINLPPKAKSKSLFSKYKVSVCVLLDNQLVIEAFGSQYCSNLRKKIIDLFKIHIDNIVSQRNSPNLNLSDNLTDTHSLISEHPSDIDIDDIHISPSNHDLLSKYNALLIHNQVLSSEIKLLKQELDRIWALAHTLASH